MDQWESATPCSAGGREGLFSRGGDLQGACWLVAAHIPGDGVQTGTGSDGRLSGSGWLSEGGKPSTVPG